MSCLRDMLQVTGRIQRSHWYVVNCFTWWRCALTTSGLENDLTADFVQLRRKTVDKNLLEVSRLEKRLTRLTQLLANPLSEPPTSPGSILWSFSLGKNQRKQLEQSVVTWEDDASVARCPFCQQEFSTYTFRRHHCRLCGRVVCGDPSTDCSAEVGLNVTASM